MVVDACAAANAAGLTLPNTTPDNDGRADNVFVYYAGYNEAEGASENTVGDIAGPYTPAKKVQQIRPDDGTIASVTFDANAL